MVGRMVWEVDVDIVVCDHAGLSVGHGRNYAAAL